MQEEHIQYIKNKIINPYDMTIRDFYDHVNEMYSYIYYIQLHSINNQVCYEAKWHLCSTLVPKENVCMAIHNALPTSMQDMHNHKDEDYCMVTTKNFLNYL